MAGDNQRPGYGAKAFWQRVINTTVIFELGGKHLAMKDDARPSDELIEIARGVDILIAERVSQSVIKHIPRGVKKYKLHEH